VCATPMWIRLSVCGSMIDMPRRTGRRPQARVITVALATELVTFLDWLSSYSGNPLNSWQLPALTGAMLLTGLVAIGSLGAAPKRA
jgi:hypothetical protein